MSVKTERKYSERAIWTQARRGGQQWGEGECGQCLSVCMCVPVSGRGRGGSPVSELHSFSPTHWCVFQTGGYVKGNRILALSLSHTNTYTHTHTSVGSFLVLHDAHTDTRQSSLFSAVRPHMKGSMSEQVGGTSHVIPLYLFLFLPVVACSLSSCSCLFVHFLCFIAF